MTYILGKNSLPRYNPAGEAKAREQKRIAERETEEQNKKIPVFMFQGYGFRPQYHVMRGGMYIEGPLCPKEDIKGNICLSELLGESDKTQVVCEACGFTANLPHPYQKFREIAHKKYDGYKRFIESGGRIETLDVPYNAIKQKFEDETRKIEIKWSQKDGRNMAVIYFFQKNATNTKTQVFVDFDREELRYDASHTPPKNILAVIQAIFPKTDIKIKYK